MSRPTIGIVGAHAPRQLILACNGTPFRIFGSWEGSVSSRSSELLGTVESVTARIMESVLAENRNNLSALIICNDSMANLRLFYVLRVLAGRGRVRFPVYLLDSLAGTGVARQRFVARQYAKLTRFVSSATGQEPDRESLRRAGELEEQLGQALTQLRQRRRSGHCSGAQALVAYRAAAQLSPSDAVVAVDSAVTTDTRASTKLFVTGSSHPDESVYANLESTGMIVVGEDHSTGDASWIGEAVYEPDFDSLLTRLAARNEKRPPLSSSSLTRDRVQNLVHGVEETGAEHVVALVRKHDDAHLWDLSGFRLALPTRGTPFVSEVDITSDCARRAAETVLDKISAHDEKAAND